MCLARGRENSGQQEGDCYPADMGRASNQGPQALAPHLRKTEAQARYEAFAKDTLSVCYLDSDEMVREALREMESTNEVAVDFETSSKDGKWGVRHGSLSLVQIGVSFPEPRQYLVDAQTADARLLVPLLEDTSVTKLIHYVDFELEWAKLHLGARTIASVYDTCITWQVLQKALSEMDPRAAQALLPGWEKHNNKLDTLMLKYQGMEIPKWPQSSDWSVRPLSAQQIMYAATDVAALFPLAARTREIAARLGATADVDRRTRWVKRKIHERIETAAAFSSHDDFRRARAVLQRAASAEELHRARSACRELTLSPMHTGSLDEIYEQRLAGLQEA
jgi:ribonuclease D